MFLPTTTCNFQIPSQSVGPVPASCAESLSLCFSPSLRAQCKPRSSLHWLSSSAVSHSVTHFCCKALSEPWMNKKLDLLVTEKQDTRVSVTCRFFSEYFPSVL